MSKDGRRAPASREVLGGEEGVGGASVPTALLDDESRRRKKLGSDTGGLDLEAEVLEGLVEGAAEVASELGLLDDKLPRRGAAAAAAPLSPSVVGVETPTEEVELSLRLPKRLPREVVRRRRLDERSLPVRGAGGGELKCGVLARVPSLLAESADDILVLVGEGAGAERVAGMSLLIARYLSIASRLQLVESRPR